MEAMEPPETTEASQRERTLACLIAMHEEQLRTEMRYHPDLGQIARQRAEDMAQRGYYGCDDHPFPPHVDHDGFGPDHYVCEAGYEPASWDCGEVGADPQRNTTESIGMGTRTMHSTTATHQLARLRGAPTPRPGRARELSGRNPLRDRSRPHRRLPRRPGDPRELLGLPRRSAPGTMTCSP